jgi:dipeptidyl aminopeptidase/acylaminoacyl peptidase
MTSLSILRRLRTCWTFAAICLPGLVEAGLPSAPSPLPLLRVEAAAHTGPVRRLAVDPSEKSLVTVGDDNTARIWDLESHRLKSVLRVPVTGTEPGKLYGVAISPDGRDIAVAGTTGSGTASPHRIYLFKADTGAAAGAIDARAGHVRDLAWSGDGNHLIAAYAGENGVRVFDRGGKVVFEERFEGPAYGLAVSSQGSFAVTGFDGQLRLYRLSAEGVRKAGTLALPQSDPISADFSPDGRFVAVGYLSRLGNGNVGVDVIRLDTGKVASSFQFSDVPQGNLKNVRWNRDGSALFAAGSGYRGRADFVVKKIAWPAGRVSDGVVGTDTVTDMAALSSGRMAFATFDGTWGVLKDDLTATRTVSPIFDLRGASLLRINPSATVVGWRSDETGRDITFDLAQRTWLDKRPSGLGAARSSSFKFDAREWENSFRPSLNGHAIALLPGEVSRASAVLPDNSALLLASSWNLRKLDRDGNVLWTHPFSAEIRALQVGADSKFVVIASSDGTLRWLSAADGSTVMSFLAVRDGRWILWTDDGHYDTSVGGESLIGWLVNRPDRLAADFFPVARFRERFHRPDLIDQVLSRMDARIGTTQDGTELRPADPAPAKTLQAVLPPVVDLLTPLEVRTDRHYLRLTVRLRSAADAPVSRLDVRVDGQVSHYQEEARRGDERDLMLPLTGKDAQITVFAENRHGMSGGAETRVKWTGPAPQPTAAMAAAARPKLYILSIGVSQYQRMPRLKFASKDASDFAAIMKRQHGRLYRDIEIRLLTDQDATQARIAESLRWLKEEVAPGDVGMLFLSGHGVTDKALDYVFLPVDADAASLNSTGIDSLQLTAIAQLPGRTVIFIDSCHAGQALGGKKGRAGDVTKLINMLGSEGNGSVVFSASTGSQFSVEDDAWKNGAFTKAVVEGLEGAADTRKVGAITYKALDYYVSERVKQLTGGQQSPVTTSPGVPDFELVRTR